MVQITQVPVALIKAGFTLIGTCMLCQEFDLLSVCRGDPQIDLDDIAICVLQRASKKI